MMCCDFFFFFSLYAMTETQRNISKTNTINKDSTANQTF